MNKRIALGVATALLGATGVAGASVAVTQSADVNNENRSAGLAAVTDLASLSCAVGLGQAASSGSCESSAPGLSIVDDLLSDLPGAGDLLNEAGGLQADGEDMVDQFVSDLPVPDLTSVFDQVPSICDALPVSIPMPANTMGSALSFFGSLEQMISEKLAFVSRFAPSTPTILSAPDVLDKVKGELTCAGSDDDSPLPIPVPIPLGVCEVTAGIVSAIPAPAGPIVAGAVKDAAAMTGQSISTSGDGVSADCKAEPAKVVPSSTPAPKVQSKPVTSTNTVIPATPIPAVAIPEMKVEVPMIGTVGTPAIDTAAGVIPSITVGPVATPEIKIPALPLGNLLSGLSGSASANGSTGLLGGGLLGGGLLGGLFN